MKIHERMIKLIADVQIKFPQFFQKDYVQCEIEDVKFSFINKDMPHIIYKGVEVALYLQNERTDVNIEYNYTETDIIEDWDEWFNEIEEVFNDATLYTCNHCGFEEVGLNVPSDWHSEGCCWDSDCHDKQEQINKEHEEHEAHERSLINKQEEE